MCPKNGSRRAGLTLCRTHRAAGASVWRKRASAARALPRIEVNRPSGDVADHLLRREFVALDPGGMPLLTSQKRHKWAQHFVGAPKGVAAAVSDSQHIAQLTRAVFTAAFEPVKKQIESEQRSAQT